MGQFSVEKSVMPGSALSGNQHQRLRPLLPPRQLSLQTPVWRTLTSASRCPARRPLLVTPGTQVRGILGVIDNGEVTQATLNSAATEAGIEPSAMQAKINSAIDGFRSQAASLAKSTGADPEAFFEWAKANRTGDMKEAMRNHAMQRTTAGYVPLLREFNESLAERDPEAVLNAHFPDAGVKAFRGDNGLVVLSIPGRGTMSYRSAVKAGLIAPKWS
jgi:hypothetical protein